FFRAAIAESQIAIDIGGDRKGRRHRQVQGIGQAIEYAASAADARPGAFGRSDRTNTAEYDNRQFVGAGFRSVLLARSQLASLKRQVVVTKPLNTIRECLRAYQQCAHSLSLSAHVCIG